MENTIKETDLEKAVQIAILAYFDARTPPFSEKEMEERFERLVERLKEPQDPYTGTPLNK